MSSFHVLTSIRNYPFILTVLIVQKVVGAWNWYQVEAALEAIAIGCLGGRTPGKDKPWTKEEITVFCAMARAEMKNPAVHGQYDLYVSPQHSERVDDFISNANVA